MDCNFLGHLKMLTRLLIILVMSFLETDFPSESDNQVESF